MTKWQHFLHAFGYHDWHKTSERTEEVSRKSCGPFDPRSKVQEITVVEKICCQCGLKAARPWSLDWY